MTVREQAQRIAREIVGRARFCDRVATPFELSFGERVANERVAVSVDGTLARCVDEELASAVTLDEVTGG